MLQICFPTYYDFERISLRQISAVAYLSGNSSTDCYGHLHFASFSGLKRPIRITKNFICRPKPIPKHANFVYHWIG